MLRSAISLLALLAVTAGAAAQDAGGGVDFILRPTQDATDDIWTGGGVAEAIPPDDEIGPPLAGPTGEEPVGPPLAGPLPQPPAMPVAVRRREEEADPFEPTGIALGTLNIRPAVEIGVSATDNVGDSSDDEESAVGFVVAPELSVISEDERYSIEAEVRGEAIIYGEEEFDERDAEARIRARYDIARRTSVEADIGYFYELDSYSDPETPDAAIERPAVHEFDASLGLTQRFGRFALSVAGEAERQIHEDVPLAGGGTAARDELDNTVYGIRSRASYEASGALTPYVEAAFGRREFDRETDDSGFERSSLWGELRGGLVFDFGSKLSGDVALGYRHEDIEDERLEDLNALVASASILWSPRRLTEVRLDFSTEAQPTSIADASASIVYSGELTIARRSTSRLRLETGVAVEYETFVGADFWDFTYGGFAGASYAFSRTASLEGRYIYERTESDAAESESDEHAVTVRLRLQR